MTKDYYKKKAEQLLKNFEVYKNAVETMKELEDCGVISMRKEKAARAKREYYEKLIRSTERALELLTPTERKIIEEMYFKHNEQTFFDICETCAMEKSALYRNREKALDKIGRAVFGLI